jgi:predicted DNA-binding transcriptional regulator AlpA
MSTQETIQNNYNEILTPAEVADLLKFDRQQVYELCRTRSRSRQKHPIPKLKINGNLRFRRRDVYAWLDTLAAEQREIAQ